LLLYGIKNSKQRDRPCITPRSLRRLYRVLIPGPLTNVMEEPAVELPLLDGPGISSQPGTNWLGNSVGTVWVAGTPGYPETRSN